MSDSLEQQQKTHDQFTGDSIAPDILPMNLSDIENLPDTIKMPVPQIQTGEKRPLHTLYNVPFTLVFEVAKIDISIRELMGLKKGSVVDLGFLTVDSIEVYINGMTLGYGEIIGLQQSYGVRFKELELLSQLKGKENSQQIKSHQG